MTNQRHAAVNSVTFRFSQDSNVSISIAQRFSSRRLYMAGSLNSVHYRLGWQSHWPCLLAVTSTVSVNWCVHSRLKRQTWWVSLFPTEKAYHKLHEIFEVSPKIDFSRVSTIKDEITLWQWTQIIFL